MTETMTARDFNKLRNPLLNMAVVIGIDPGLHTGTAVWSNELDQFGPVRSYTFWQAYDFVLKYDRFDTALVIEAPKKHFIYPQNHKGKNQLTRERIAFNAGENNRCATLMIERFTELGYMVEAVVPVTAKWDAKQLAMYTGYTLPTNEHVRDAIKLLWAKGMGGTGR